MNTLPSSVAQRLFNGQVFDHQGRWVTLPECLATEQEWRTHIERGEIFLGSEWLTLQDALAQQQGSRPREEPARETHPAPELITSASEQAPPAPEKTTSGPKQTSAAAPAPAAPPADESTAGTAPKKTHRGNPEKSKAEEEVLGKSLDEWGWEHAQRRNARLWILLLSLFGMFITLLIVLLQYL